MVRVNELPVIVAAASTPRRGGMSVAQASISEGPFFTLPSSSERVGGACYTGACNAALGAVSRATNHHRLDGHSDMVSGPENDPKTELRMRRGFIIVGSIIVLALVVTLFGLTSLDLPFIRPS